MNQPQKVQPLQSEKSKVQSKKISHSSLILPNESSSDIDLNINEVPVHDMKKQNKNKIQFLKVQAVNQQQENQLDNDNITQQSQSQFPDFQYENIYIAQLKSQNKKMSQKLKQMETNVIQNKNEGLLSQHQVNQLMRENQELRQNQSQNSIKLNQCKVNQAMLRKQVQTFVVQLDNCNERCYKYQKQLRKVFGEKARIEQLLKLKSQTQSNSKIIMANLKKENQQLRRQIQRQTKVNIQSQTITQKKHKQKIDIKQRQINELIIKLKSSQENNKKSQIQKGEQIKDLNIKYSQSRYKSQQLKNKIFQLQSRIARYIEFQKSALAKTCQLQAKVQSFQKQLRRHAQIQANLDKKVNDLQSQRQKVTEQYKQRQIQLKKRYAVQLNDLIPKMEDKQSGQSILQCLAIIQCKNDQIQVKLRRDNQVLLDARNALQKNCKVEKKQKMGLMWEVEDLINQKQVNDKKYKQIQTKSKTKIASLQNTIQLTKNDLLSKIQELSSLNLQMTNFIKLMNKYYPNCQQFKVAMKQNQRKTIELLQLLIVEDQKVRKQSKQLLIDLMNLENMVKLLVQQHAAAQKDQRKIKKLKFKEEEDKMKVELCKNICKVVNNTLYEANQVFISKISQIKQISDQKIDLDTIVDNKLTQIQELTGKVKDLQKKVQTLLTDSKNQTTLLNQSNISLAKQRMRHDQEISDLQNEIVKCKQIINKYNQVNRENYIQIKQFKEKVKKLEEQVKDKNEQTSKLTAKIENLKRQLFEVNASLEQAKNNLSDKREVNAELTKKNNNLNNEISDKVSALELKSKQIKTLQELRQKLRDQILQGTNQISNLKKTKNDLENQNKQMFSLNEQSQLQKKKSEYEAAQLNHKCQSLENEVKILGEIIQKKLGSMLPLNTYKETLNFIESFSVKIPNVLMVSNILLDFNMQRQWLLEQISNFMGKSIAVSSNLLFQSDLCGGAKLGSVLPKLDSQFSFMIIQ